MEVGEFGIRRYYTEFFPLATIREWIQYKVDGVAQEPLSRRECAFWFDAERFSRWSTIDRMNDLIGSVQTSPPERMEIGPVYDHDLSERRTANLLPEHRELVFDIDADDFKSIKCCCGDSEICPKCWPYMSCALDCLTKALAENFGFHCVLPVFSGRRGIHIWVCDERARALTGHVRECIVKYLNIREIVCSPSFVAKKCPLAESMLGLCEKYFVQIAEEQHIFTCEPILVIVKGLVGEKWLEAIKEKLRRVSGSMEQKWESIKEMKLASPKFKDTEAYYKLVFSFSFPALDANVTTSMNHLLKSPFSYHPKSGFISVPIPKAKRSVFPRDWVPSLSALVEGDAATRETYHECLRSFEDFVKLTVAPDSASQNNAFL